MSAPVLPTEILDMILDHIFTCPTHKWSSKTTPCTNWHTPTALPSLLPLRLVSRSFTTHLTPPLFTHLTCKGPRRHQTLLTLSHNPTIASYVRVLRLEIAPEDLKGHTRRVNSAALPADKKLLHYFETLRHFLAPLLKRFTHIRVLHITSTYDGILSRRQPMNEAMAPCLEALCKSVRKAGLEELKEVVLGVPYEGGYTTFFEDLDDKRWERALRRCGRGVTSASVKLFDHGGNFTCMPFF